MIDKGKTVDGVWHVVMTNSRGEPILSRDRKGQVVMSGKRVTMDFAEREPEITKYGFHASRTVFNALHDATHTYTHTQSLWLCNVIVRGVTKENEYPVKVCGDSRYITAMLKITPKMQMSFARSAYRQFLSELFKAHPVVDRRFGFSNPVHSADRLLNDRVRHPKRKMPTCPALVPGARKPVQKWLGIKDEHELQLILNVAVTAYITSPLETLVGIINHATALRSYWGGCSDPEYPHRQQTLFLEPYETALLKFWLDSERKT